MAIHPRSFHYDMPEGGREAIDSELTLESDPTWMMSDDSHTANGFTLTEAGREMVRARGLVCQCALSGAYNNHVRHWRWTRSARTASRAPKRTG